MRLAPFVLQTVLFTVVVAVPSKFAASDPLTIEKRDGQPPSCVSTLKTPTPAGMRCGATGNIAKTKTTQNLISSKTNVATVNACADQCRTTTGCGTFSYAGKKCTLYKQTPADNKFVAGKSSLQWYNQYCFQCSCAGSNQVKQQDGTCACSTGYVYATSSLSCTQCPAGLIPNANSTSCVCQGNQQPSADGTSCACAAGSSVQDASQPYLCTQDCPQGAILNGTTCMCQGNQQLSADGTSCACAAGTTVQDPSQPYLCCPQGATLNGTTCTCTQPGYIVSADGLSCVSECPANSVFADGICNCLPGYTISSDGSTCASVCPSGTQYNGGSCYCPNTNDYLSGSTCLPCPGDQIGNGNSCTCLFGVVQPDGCGCPNGAVIDSGGCRCIEGVLNNNNTACVDPCDLNGSGQISLPFGLGCACPPTYELNSSGVCACPSGTSESSSGQCTCPGGQTFSNTTQQCVCPANSVTGTCNCGNNAILSSDSLSCDCPSGFVLSSNGYDCVCPSGQTQCDNYCTDLSSDSINCGSCDYTCPYTRDSTGHGVLWKCVNSQCIAPS